MLSIDGTTNTLDTTQSWPKLTLLNLWFTRELAAMKYRIWNINCSLSEEYFKMDQIEHGGRPSASTIL